jgi:DNA-binding NtrC family response regulator
MSGRKILIVDDDPQIRMVLSNRLEAKGYNVFQAENGNHGLKLVKSNNPDIILLDLQMPGMDGITVLKHLNQKFPEIPVIILTAYGTIEQAVEAMKYGAYDFLPKPSTTDHILLVVKKALLQKGLREENQFLRDELNNRYEMITGVSYKIQKVMKTVKKVASNKTTVLICGESGTGKQLFARAVHNMSDRRNKPFIQVNCTTLSEQLLESDLFGHEKGAFNGAFRQKKGRFELADEGTLFLDEIGDISPSIQARLLHVLEYREFQRVGGVDTLKADVRIIAATNKDLPKEVKKGNFREDLLYRLNVITLHLPTLRARTEDIPLLTEHFLKKHSDAMQKNIIKITPKTMNILKNYHWPGNIRELENAIERAVVLAPGTMLTPDLLPLLVEDSFEDEIKIGISLDQALLMYKKEFITRTLRFVKNNQTKAAKILQIQRTYLNRLVKELNINI